MNPIWHMTLDAILGNNHSDKQRADEGYGYNLMLTQPCVGDYQHKADSTVSVWTTRTGRNAKWSRTVQSHLSHL
jgi:hypothetical protein